MASRSDKLKDDQALLLMYIADELSAAERADVESRLEAEAVLQAQLEALRRPRDVFGGDGMAGCGHAAGFRTRRRRSRRPGDSSVDRRASSRAGHRR